MSDQVGFRTPRVLLPQPHVNLKKWAVIACDQYTAEPDYWRDVASAVGDAPSTLNMIFPEAYLESPDAPTRIAQIQASMKRALAEGLLREHEGAVYVERTVGGHVRCGLMLELDLEHYDFSSTSQSLVRPTEGTIVARLAPRIAVREHAALELPHILVLIDDPACTVIEPIAAARSTLTPLYSTELMMGGGHVAGFAVGDALAEQATRTLNALASPAAFAARYGVAPGTPVMLFAVGDGNHSLATAKAIWERNKSSVGLGHPSRWALVEIENIHDSALQFEPIHRLLFGVRGDIRRHWQKLLAATSPALKCPPLAQCASAWRRRMGPRTRWGWWGRARVSAWL